MNKTLTALLLAAVMAGGDGLAAQDKLLAFPGAVGFGRYTTGGRGGEIYHVTNLNDSGEGSLRDAVSRGNRIVVFDVCGTINLKSTLIFKSNITVLGQTAPGEGIQVYGNRVSFSNAHNIIVRHMRFRMGIGGDSGKDCCGTANETRDQIFDHLSVLWGRDENFSISSNDKKNGPKNITIQNSIIGQGLQTHSCGGLIQTDGGVTLYRNLYIENKTRNPKVKGLNQYVNNVVYNWGNGGGYIMSDSEGDSWADIQNNYFIRGPWNGTEPFVRGIKSFRYYGAGNYYDDNRNGVLDGHLMTTEETCGSQNGTAPYSTWMTLEELNADINLFNQNNPATTQYCWPVQHIDPIENMMTAEEALHWVENNAGASLPVHDEVDKYLLDELKTYGDFTPTTREWRTEHMDPTRMFVGGTNNGISSEKQLPHQGTGVLSGGVKPLDTDGDGIPDAWEIANGLNPNDPSDAKAIAANGYANIENYVFTITEAYPYIKKPVSLAVTRQDKTEIDLSWGLNNNTDNGFIIELSADNGNTWTEAARAAAGATEATLTGLVPNSTYKVRVRAWNSDGIFSDYSDVVTTETIGDPAAPNACVAPFPANGAKQGVASGLTLTWENTSKNYYGTVKYTVYLGEAADALQAVATDITEKQYVTSGILPDKTYYWRVDAKNDVGTTEGTVWNFSTTAGGVLFYTDFYKQPDAWFEKYGSITANTNIINAANKTAEVAGMTFGSGEKTVRIVAMKEANNSASTSENYGPATADDAGASDRCVQFTTPAAGGYLLTPEVTGPCVVTLWLANTETKSKTVKLYAKTGGEETLVQDMNLGNKKRMYKFSYTHMASGPVQFKIDNNSVQFNINDILIERYVTPSGNDPLELTSGDLVNDNLSYADGSLTLSFNQDIRYNGTAAVSGKTQWENFSISASGKKLTIAYEALNVNTAYTVSFPEGAVTDVSGEQSFTADVKLNTCDFPAAKAEGETHFGKAASALPLNFAPFNATAPFETVGGLVQTSQKDYPHWVQASGEISADAAKMTSTNDKLMTYFEPRAKQVALLIEYEGTGNPRLKVQESRNCDITPGWRTLRVLEKADFPFHAELDLNPETRMVKLAPVSIGGTLIVKTFRISDADGYFGDDFVSGLGDISADNIAVLLAGNTVSVAGVAESTPVTVYDIAGHAVAAGRGECSFTLAPGFYIVSVHGVKTVKVKL
ncbi:MAG: fibronectin type III domain-containing protein [Duncaniella sp.]|nr:fibronectin type III domain-containing protein [Duncaniella sp.]